MRWLRLWKIRDWKVEKDNLKFSFDVMFKGQIDNISPFKMLIETFRKLNLYDPEVIIIGGYSYISCWAALLWAKKRKKKVILMNESHFMDKPRNVIKESIKKLFVSQCDAALTDGIRHKDYIISLGLPSDRVFIKRGTGPIDINWFNKQIARFKNDKVEIRNKLGIPQRNFLFVGRFSPEKNIMFLLRAYKRLVDDGIENWGLILVGDGPQRKDIEYFITKNNLKNVTLAGFRQKEKLLLFYAISDIFILPSISEPWGLVVGEAMASGLPVLVSKWCGCYPDIVHDNINGFSFSPLNLDELLELMKDISRGKYDLKKMGDASLEIIRDYTPEEVVRVYKNAIYFVTGENESPSCCKQYIS